MVRLVPILVADVHTVYGTVASCLPDEPSSLNVPDGCACYIDDVAIPVSWSTVDARINKLDLDVQITETFHRYHVLTLPFQNYVGATLAVALQTALDEAAAEELLNFEVSYDFNDNLSTSKLIYLEETVSVSFVPDVDLVAGVLWDERLVMDWIESLNGVLRIDQTITLSARKPTYTAYIDSHTTRKLYLTSSSLAKYDNISTFGEDVLINKTIEG